MLIEAFEFITSFCQNPVRSPGYLYEAVAFHSRYRRCKEAWQPHIAQCNQLIKNKTLQCQGRNSVLVPGSGLLLECPVDELSHHFSRVVLADMVHLRAAREKAKSMNNVTFLHADISGVAEPLAMRSPRLPEPLPPMQPLLAPQEHDLVLSVNLLSQLPYVPRLLLEKAGYSENNILSFCRALIEAHIRYLRQFRHALLITDTLEHTYDRRGNLVSREDILYGVTMPAPIRSWEWEIAPFGEERGEYRRCRDVSCYELS